MAESKDLVDVNQLRARTRTAIAKYGLVETAERIGVAPATLMRFAHSAGRSHRGTVELVRRAVK